MTATKQQSEMILASSPEAASIQTVTGWVARDGRFWGEDERMARFCGSTHRICESNPAHGPVENRSYCKACYAERKHAQWQAMPKAPFSGELMPLCVFDSDRFFFDIEDLRYWLEEHALKPEGARLVQCKPVHAAPIDPNEHFADDLPEDGEVPDELREAFDALNAVIGTCKPLCWRPANELGVLLPADFLNPADTTEQAA